MRTMFDPPNPNYVSAPFEMSFMFAVPEAVMKWSRKRRLRWIRRTARKHLRMDRILPSVFQLHDVLWMP